MSGVGSHATGAGWFHAAGDPADTVRYWNGSEWQGEPTHVSASAAVAPPGAPVAPSPAASGTSWGKGPKVVAALLIAIAFGGGALKVQLESARQAQVDAVSGFLEAVVVEDTEGIESALEPTCFTDEERIQLDALLAGYAGAEVTQLVSTNASVSTSEASSGVVAGSLALADGTEVRLDLFMIEAAPWKVCGVDVDTTGEG